MSKWSSKNRWVGGTPPGGWLPVRLADLYDTTTYLNGGTIDADPTTGHLRIQAPGSAATPHPKDAVSALFRIRDFDLRAAELVGSDNVFKSPILRYAEEGTPDTSGDFFRAVGFVDDPDLNVATGFFIGAVYTGAAKAPRIGRLNTGTMTWVDGSTAALDVVVGTPAQVTLQQLWDTWCYSVQRSAPSVRTSFATIGAGTAQHGSGPIIGVVTCGRTASTAGTITSVGREFHTPNNGLGIADGL